jgi:hypothetical protein
VKNECLTPAKYHHGTHIHAYTDERGRRERGREGGEEREREREREMGSERVGGGIARFHVSI